MIERNEYLNKLISRKWNGMVKVITGIRRCGKSYLLFEIFKKHLLDDGVPTEQIIEVSLDADPDARLFKCRVSSLEINGDSVHF